MVSKRKLHHVLVLVKRIKIWQLIIALVFCGFIAAFLLRQNNLRMVELRNAVTKADQEAGDTKQALTNLQNYVSQHMNTDLGNGIYLQYSYQRAYAAAVEAAARATNPNAAIYEQVELECRAVYQRTQSFPAYTQCAHDKLSQLAPGQDALGNIKTPSIDLYHFNFVSPLISFDMAGLFVILTVLIILAIVVRITTYFALKLLLSTRSSRI